MNTHEYVKMVLNDVKHDIREYKRGKYFNDDMRDICECSLSRLYTLGNIAKCTDITHRLPLDDIYRLQEELEKLESTL